MTVPEVGKWRKSSRSQTDNACVELHPVGAVRDSKNPDGPALAINWASLVSAVKTGVVTS